MMSISGMFTMGGSHRLSTGTVLATITTMAGDGMEYMTVDITGHALDNARHITCHSFEMDAKRKMKDGRRSFQLLRQPL